MNVRQAVVPALVLEGQSFMVDAQAVENRRIQIVNVHGILRDVVTEIVGFTVDNSGFDSATGHPFGVTPRMVIATIIGLA